MRLAFAVIGILAKDHDFDGRPRRVLEGVEDLACGRIYFVNGAFGVEEVAKMVEVGLAQLVANHASGCG